MKNNQVRLIVGLFAATVCAAALGIAACGDSADDCHNTKTCKPPPCNMDAGVDGSPLDGVDGGGCCLQEDGGVVCEQE
jgi:hypothetical protein